MEEDLFIEKIEIADYEDLVKIIKGKSRKCGDLRNKFVFRGVENSAFKLIPSALREDDKINNYVDENFKLELCTTVKEAIEDGFKVDESDDDSIVSIFVNKYFKQVDGENCNLIFSKSEFRFRKEINALFNFLNYSDKVGLKIPIKQNIRELIEHNIGKTFDYKTLWPCPDFYELISLAQHYGIPTRALDWSYDYKISLYFAVKNILAEDYLEKKDVPSQGVLWAYNYRYFEKNHYFNKGGKFPIQYYRPEYNANPNLNAQKGLFTFVVNRIGQLSEKSFDKFIIDNLLNKSHDFDKYPQPNKTSLIDDEKIFYKFIIPEEAKPNILNELYLDGYSEEYLFPGYRGATLAVENRVKLDKILKKRSYFNDNGLVIINKI